MDQLLDVPTAAKLLGVAENTLYAWTSSKRIPYFKLGGRVRFSEQALREWLEQHAVKPIEMARI